MTADPKIRAERRYQELLTANKQVNFNEVYDNLLDRDAQDSSRSVSPLRKSDDAIEVDTGHITREEQFALVLALAENKIKKNNKKLA
jgi:cytidylate kinase